MKTVIGAGILSLPYTFSRLGYLLALLMIVLVVGLAQLMCILLLNSKNLSRHNNYSTIAVRIFQNIKARHFMKYVSSGIMMSGNVGFCIVELIILKGSVKKIMDSCIPDES